MIQIAGCLLLATWSIICAIYVITGREQDEIERFVNND